MTRATVGVERKATGDVCLDDKKTCGFWLDPTQHQIIDVRRGGKVTKLKKYGTHSALQLLLDEAALDALEGRVADYIPELRQADVDDSGISICYLGHGHADGRT